MAKITPDQPEITYTVELTHKELLHIWEVLGSLSGDDCASIGVSGNLNTELYGEFDDATDED